jgi:osmotically-inducible protein OsmY
MSNLLTQSSQSSAPAFPLSEDDLLADAASRVFEQSAYAALRGVACECRKGVLTLRGRIPSYFLNQVALQLARNLAGVHGVVNRLEVHYEGA